MRGVAARGYDMRHGVQQRTYTATWTLARPVRDDKLLLDLDGDGEDGVQAAEGK